MFRNRSLTYTLVICLFLSFGGCFNRRGNNAVEKPAIVFDESRTEDGFYKNLPYKIVEIDDNTGKVKNIYFALGKDIKYDEILSEAKFTDLNGVKRVITSSIEFEGQE